jgi:hypothetical protein
VLKRRSGCSIPIVLRGVPPRPTQDRRPQPRRPAPGRDARGSAGGDGPPDQGRQDGRVPGGCEVEGVGAAVWVD